jgi:hypothetical protein
MANTFKLKRSAVPGKVPTTGDLQLGELALNTYDGRLYTLKDNGSQSVTEIGGAASGVSSFSAGTTGLTPSTATTGAVTLAGILAVANGGTGVGTSTGSGSNVLSTSPTLVTPLLGTPTSGNLANCTGYTFANLASKPTTLSGYGITDALGATAKAADSELIDGIDSTRLLYGWNGSGTSGVNATQNVYELGQYKSGFWDTTAAAWLPTTDWYWGATFAHRNNTGAYNYSGQLAFKLGGGGDSLYARTIDNGTPTGWSKLLSSGNFNTYAPTLTGTGASGSWGISVTGNAATATKLTTPRTLTIGNTGKTFDGSANVTWSLAEIGAGGSGSFTASATAPSNPSVGDEWLDTDDGFHYTWVDDGNTAQWVELGPQNIDTGVTFTANSVAPLNPAAGDEWLDLDNGITYSWVSDGDTAQWVELGPQGFSRADTASTVAAGIVQLTDSVTTTSSTLAATATAVKTAYDRAAYTVTVTATSKTLVNRERCTVTAATQTITLPATPSAGWEVAVTIGGSFTDTVIARNGSNIMSLAENMTVDKANVSVTLYYVDATRGWRII